MKTKLELLTSTRQNPLQFAHGDEEAEIAFVYAEDAPPLDLILQYVQAIDLLKVAGLWPATMNREAKGFFDADFSVEGLHQEGNAIVGTVVLTLKAGPLKAKFSEVLRVSTLVPNPVIVVLGTFNIAGLAVPVVAEVTYDLIQRTIVVELSFGGLISVVKKTFHF